MALDRGVESGVSGFRDWRGFDDGTFSGDGIFGGLNCGRMFGGAGKLLFCC